MKSRVLIVVLLLVVVHAAVFSQGSVGNRGQCLRCDGVSCGYTLFAPMSCDLTYLVDLDDQVVCTWRSAFLPSAWVYLLVLFFLSTLSSSATDVPAEISKIGAIAGFGELQVRGVPVHSGNLANSRD